MIFKDDFFNDFANEVIGKYKLKASAKEVTEIIINDLAKNKISIIQTDLLALEKAIIKASSIAEKNKSKTIINKAKTRIPNLNKLELY